MNLNYAHLCEHAFISESGVPSFMGVFGGIRARSLPAFRQNTAVVLNIDPEDTNKHIVRIELKSPKGQIVKKQDNSEIGPIDAVGQSLGYLTNFKDLKFEEAGLYSFEIFIDDKKLAELKFNLEIAENS
ncbi:MAG: hypothetical protein ABIH10_01290 [Spirochaetota bacterium]